MPAVTTVPLRDLQPGLFGRRGGAQRFALASAPAVDAAIAAGAPVFLGVSGGRDSQALALRVSEHLDAVGHAGPRLLIHSDLGRVEWRDSLPVCQRLAERLGLEHVVVRRQAGGLLDRWRSRWAGNVRRYAALECVKLILPWSTPAQRVLHERAEVGCDRERDASALSRRRRDLGRRHPGAGEPGPGPHAGGQERSAHGVPSTAPGTSGTRSCRGRGWT